MSEDRIQLTRLFDFYGELLSDKQKLIFRYYYLNDLSLFEISEIEGVSRAAVYDIINRCRTDLMRYEDLLHFSAQAEKRAVVYREIEKISTDQKINDLIHQCKETEIEGGQYD